MQKLLPILFTVLTVSAVVLAGMSHPATPPPGTPPKAKSGFDIDLATMSRTMVYSRVYELVSNPQRYRGKTIRMAGNYATYKDPDTGIRYHACLITDAMACCAQGVEFAPTNAVVYPRDFPATGQAIVVQGVFDTYRESGENYVRVRDALLTVR